MRQLRAPMAWGLSGLVVLSAIGLLAPGVHLLGGLAPKLTATPAAGTAASELAAATTSLGSGHGPAARAAVSCALTGPNAASCSARGAAGFSMNASWTNLTARAIPGPGARAGAQMVYDAADGYVLLFGGEFSGATPFTYGVDRDTWTFSNGVWTNISSTVSGGPPPNAVAPAMAYDPWDQEVVLFGGENNTHGYPGSYQSQTWTYHAKVWANITGTAGAAPRGRIIASMVADTTDHRMILFGGMNATLRFNDTWLFSAGTWSNITGASGPLPKNLAYAFLSDDPPENGVLLIGVNFVARPYQANTWIYTGGTWTNVTATASISSPAPYAPILTYSPQTSAVVLADTLQINPSNGGAIRFPITWVFYNGAWMNVTGQTGVVGDATLGAITTAPDGSVLAFAGTVDGISTNNWLYGFSLPPSIVAQVTAPTGGATDVNRVVSVTATPTNGIAPTRLNLTWGDGAYSGGSTSGSHAYAAVGTYTVSATVTDFAGRTARSNVSVEVHPALTAPVVTITPHAPTTGQNVTLNATASGGTPAYSFTWTFPAGVTASGPSVHHPFPTSGSISVSVEATDAAGATANATVLVNVSASASSAFSLTSGTGLYVLVVVIVLVLVAVVAVALMRRRRKAPPPPPTPYVPPTADATTPPTANPPPPGAA